MATPSEFGEGQEPVFESPGPRRIDFTVPITTEATLRLYIRHAFGVEIPSKRICHNHVSPWEAFAYSFFARGPASIWKASRGYGGKSFLVATLGACEATTLTADVNLLGGSGVQSTRILDATNVLWAHPNAPRDKLVGTPGARTLRFVAGNQMQALMASQASVRGPHPQRLRLDEVDVMKQDIVDAALGQPMDKLKTVTDPDGRTHAFMVKANTVFSSTHQFAKGTMTTMMQRAKESGWPCFEWCYKETLMPHGWVAPSEIEEKRILIPTAMWNAEYEGQEPSPGDRAISTPAVERMFKASLGRFPGKLNELVQIQKPLPGRNYAVGADWAKKQDHTVITVINTDVRPIKVVAWIRMARLPWPVMVAKFDELVTLYNDARAAHDATGLGTVVADLTRSKVIDFVMTGRDRADMLSEYIAAIEADELEGPLIEWMEGEHKYASVDDVYSTGAQFHLPDSICSGALAYHAANPKFRAAWATGS